MSPNKVVEETCGKGPASRLILDLFNADEQKEAKGVVHRTLQGYRFRSYEGVTALLRRDPHSSLAASDSGMWCRVKIQMFRNLEEGCDLRISGAVDDGGLRAYFSLGEASILSPAGHFVGES